MSTLLVTLSRPTGTPCTTLAHPSLFALVLTLARVPLAGAIVLAALARSTAWGVVLLLVFVALDILDGVVARRINIRDDATRRGLDSIIDRLTVASALVAASSTSPALLLPGVIALATSLATFPIALRSYRAAGIVLQAPHWHKLWSLAFLVSGLTFFWGIDFASISASLIASATLIYCTATLVSQHLSILPLSGRTMRSWK